MARVDNIALANKKNRVGNSKLTSELNRINREKRAVMRLLNNEKQRFKNKYSKLDVFSEHRGTEPSDVIMYETHNPGFCYRRNGECRMPQSPFKNTTVGFEDIHVLIFTDGELDIDKILCLHLLSAHRTETLTPPPRSQRAMMFIARLQSPLERLVERTKRRWPEDKLTRLLPIYVIDCSAYYRVSRNENVIRDGRLAARLIVNEKLNILIRSVMTALDKSNKEMLADLIEKSKNTEYLLRMLRKPKMQEFVKNLNSLNVISCCESFCLTMPFRIIPTILDIRTPSGQLENLVRQIRKNIFKLPMNCCWEEEFTKYNLYSDSDDESVTSAEAIPLLETEISSQPLNVNSDFQVRGSDVWERPATSLSYTMDASAFEMRGDENFSRKSTPRSVILSRKRSDSLSPEPVKRAKSPNTTLNLEQIRGMDFEKLATLLSKKANSARKKDLETFEKTPKVDNKFPSPRTSAATTSASGNSIPSNSTPAASTPTSETKTKKNNKIFLKQTKCAACREKWKQPLPSPKTSCLHRPSTSASDRITIQDTVSHSSHLISTLIDQELKFWNEYKVSKNDYKFSSAMYGVSPRNCFDKNGVIEIIDLDELDLAKIRQEIREHETKKKLDQFLNG